jgi:hypothetical protein
MSRKHRVRAKLYSLESAAGADAISDGGAGKGSSESAESADEEGAVSLS